MKCFVMHRRNKRFISGQDTSTAQQRRLRFEAFVCTFGCPFIGVLLSIQCFSSQGSVKQRVGSLVACTLWWIFSILFLPSLYSKLKFHSRLARQGTVIPGVLKHSTVTSDGDDPGTELKVEYNFVTPDGENVDATAKGNYRGSNMRDLTPVGYSAYNRTEIAVNVLFLDRKAFTLL
jgi:hypothetical protein